MNSVVYVKSDLTMRVAHIVGWGLAFLSLVACTASDQAEHVNSRVLTEGAYYPSPEQQQQLKAALASANIAYQTEMRNGEEVVIWDAKDSVAVKAARESVIGPDLPPGRHISFSKKLRGEFEVWLRASKISFFIKPQYGNEYVVWNEGDDPRVREWLRARLPEDVFAAFIGRAATSASGSK